MSLETKASDAATEARVAVSDDRPNELLVGFRYLNHGDAVYADLLYTLPSTTNNDVSVTGSIIGARRLKGRKWETEASSRVTLVPIALAFGFIVAGVLIAQLFSMERGGQFMISVGVVLAVGGAFQMWQYIRVRAPQWVRDLFPTDRRGIFLTTRYISGS